MGEKSETSPRNNYVSAVISGTFQTAVYTATAPMERVHSLLQCQNELVKTGRLSSPYKGMTDCFLRTVRHEGYLSLWRGLSVSLSAVWLMEAVDSLAPVKFKNDALSTSPLVAFFVARSLIYPIGYAKVRLMNDVAYDGGRLWHHSLDSSKKTQMRYGKNRLFRGGFDAIAKAIVSDGLPGIYRGFTLHSFGYYGLLHAQMAAGEFLSSYSQDNQNKRIYTNVPNQVIRFGFFFVGIPVLFYPVQTVYRRMMLTSGESKKYTGSMNALNQIVRKEGVSALYKGVTPRIITGILRASACYACYFAVKFGIVRSNVSMADLRV